MTEETKREVLFPPMGIAHITEDIADLLRHRTQGAVGIEVMTASQPNGPPHLGTVVMFMTAFAVAEHLASTLALPVTLILDVLDNGPAEQREVDGIVYARSLAAVCDEGVSRAEQNLVPFRAILARLSERTGVPQRARTYTEFQSTPSFRRLLIRALHEPALVPIVSPSEQRLRLRFPCPHCGWADKAAVTTEWRAETDGTVQLRGRCFEHGRHQIELSEYGGGLVDTNTPLRSVLKAAMLVERERDDHVLTVSVDGADWSGVWLSRVVVEGLGRLGYSAATFPSQLFAPLIVDWSGAKFSKSVYVGGHAYSYLPPGLADYGQFEAEYGDAGFDRLWNEVSGWVADPRRLFRSYSIDYLAQILLAK